MNITEIKVKITFTEPLLGSQSANPDIHEEFIASKAETMEAAKEEVAAVTPADPEAEFEKAMTVFPRNPEGQVHLWDYQVKGFIKEAVKALLNGGDENFTGLKAYKSVISDHVFVSPRRIMLKDSSGNPITTTKHLSRSLVAQTAQGQRICLATSELIPDGTTCELTIKLLGKTDSRSKGRAITDDGILAALDYGQYKGMGQWRGGSYGRFTVEIIK